MWLGSNVLITLPLTALMDEVTLVTGTMMMKEQTLLYANNGRVLHIGKHKERCLHQQSC